MSVVGIILVLITFRTNKSLSETKKRFIPVIAFTLVSLIIIIIVTEAGQYVPVSDKEEDSDPNSSLSVRLIRDSTILIPFRSVFLPNQINRNITAVIDFQTPITNITNVKLSGPTNSILTYHGDFKNTVNHVAKDKSKQIVAGTKHLGISNKSTTQYGG